MAELKKKQDEEEDARRQAEWDARAAKIARSMQYMANTVGKQVEEQERVAAEKLQRHLENKRKQDEEDERKRQAAREARLRDMRHGLNAQIEERERQAKLEAEQNQAYMRKVMEEAEEEKRRQELKVKTYKDNLKDNQSFIRSQMKDKESSPAAVAWKAKALMNEDEVRYNKDIFE